MLNAGFSTLADLKSRLLPDAGIEETQWDAALSSLGLATATRMQSYCNRTFERLTGTVESYSARCLSVVLKCYPVESIASIQIRSMDGTLTASTVDYQTDKASGLLTFYSIPGVPGEELVITYTGGFWLDDGGSMPSGATALPADVLEAWIAQCQAAARSRQIFGPVSLGNMKDTLPTGALLPEVEEVLRGYRRFASN